MCQDKARISLNKGYTEHPDTAEAYEELKLGLWKRLRLGAALHFLIAIGHVGCLFALDEAFEAYGIREIMHQIVSGQIWMLYALTIGLVLTFTVAGLYALSASGDISRLPLTRLAIITVVVLYSLRALAGGISCIYDFRWLQFISSLIPAIIAWCYWPGVMRRF